MAEKKLFVDLDICSINCKECVAQCSYFYHPENNGMYPLRELLTFILVCRKCEEPHCVNSCPQNALEKQENNIIKRHYFRCIGCKSCSHGCPYGVIYPELVPYLNAKCDLCADRCDQKDEPACACTCPYGALSLKDVKPSDAEYLYAAGDNIIVHSKHWMREKA